MAARVYLWLALFSRFASWPTDIYYSFLTLIVLTNLVHTLVVWISKQNSCVVAYLIL